MKKRKAFTLIELLAVIIVLAIIALIAMPIIFNVIENAKLKSLENSAYGVVDAVRLYYMENLMNIENGTVPLEGSVTTLSLSGEHPTEGIWKIVNDADLEDGRGIQIEGVKFSSMSWYVCESVIKDGVLTGEITCLKDNVTFTVEDGSINENGWANADFNVSVSVEGVSNIKYCIDDEECTPTEEVSSNSKEVTISTEGTNYFCVGAEGVKTRCNIYSLDKSTPTLTAKTANPTVKEGQSNDIITFLNEPIYGNSGGNVVCKLNDNEITNTSSLAVGSHTVTCNAVGNNGKSSSDVILTILVNENEPEPNAPELFSNMIPVTYNTSTSKWKYADITQEWYDYSAKQWANAVVLKANPSKTYSVGNDIEITDIAQMYVWIPRYKYTIFNGNNGSAKNPIQINVIFEEGTRTTGTVRCHDAVSGTAGTSSEVCTDSTQTNNAVTNGKSTYTHPAFCFGRKKTDGSCNGTELTGIWVGKFEVSGTASSAGLTVLPNVNPLISKNVSTYFSSMKGVANAFNIKVNDTTYADSHMMKNMDWGAVAYLKQSKYGLGLTDIAVNNYYNDSSGTIALFFMTGCGSDYSATDTTTTCARYDTTNGKKASITGNIYGIYDMSGGTYEYVMGNMVNTSGEFYPSNAGTFSPDVKYYDSYTYYYGSVGYSAQGRGKLGDATKEILTSFGTTSNSVWYGDSFNIPFAMSSEKRSWFERGGYGTNGNFNAAGVFVSNHFTGAGVYHTSSRIVITQP